MNRIASRDNSKIKFARRVRDGKEPGFIFIEGVRLVEEALLSDIELVEAFVADDFAAGPRQTIVTSDLLRRGSPMFAVPREIAVSLSDTQSGQGIVVIAERPVERVLDDMTANRGSGVPVVLFLEQTNNPSNLGAVIRTAEAAGAAGVIVSDRSTDPFVPKALRASMGSAFRIPICTGQELNAVLKWAVESGLRTTAADVGAGRFYTAPDWTTPRLLVLGSEAHGLDQETKERIDELIKIPMSNGVESLNLAVSCGIVLFEAKRQNES